MCDYCRSGSYAFSDYRPPEDNPRVAAFPPDPVRFVRTSERWEFLNDAHPVPREPAANPLYEPTQRSTYIGHAGLEGEVNYGLFSIKRDRARIPLDEYLQMERRNTMAHFGVTEWEPDITF